MILNLCRSPISLVFKTESLPNPTLLLSSPCPLRPLLSILGPKLVEMFGLLWMLACGEIVLGILVNRSVQIGFPFVKSGLKLTLMLEKCLFRGMSSLILKTVWTLLPKRLVLLTKELSCVSALSHRYIYNGIFFMSKRRVISNISPKLFTFLFLLSYRYFYKINYATSHSPPSHVPKLVVYIWVNLIHISFNALIAWYLAKRLSLSVTHRSVTCQFVGSHQLSSKAKI